MRDRLQAAGTHTLKLIWIKASHQGHFRLDPLIPSLRFLDKRWRHHFLFVTFCLTRLQRTSTLQNRLHSGPDSLAVVMGLCEEPDLCAAAVVLNTAMCAVQTKDVQGNQ